MEINELVQKAHQNAIEKGFWEYFYNNRIIQVIENTKEQDEICDTLENAFISQNLLLIVSEISEAMEGLRKNDMDNFREELADVAIRLADLAGALEIDLEEEIVKKMEKNKNRPHMHNKKF